MTIKCKTNYLPTSIGKVNIDLREHIEIGKSYLVFGIYLDFNLKTKYFLIFNENHLINAPQEMFLIIDSRLSSYFNYYLTKGGNAEIIPELIKEDEFIENFSERNDKERLEFDVLKNRMLQELED